jgi:hypothetical protein
MGSAYVTYYPVPASAFTLSCAPITGGTPGTAHLIEGIEEFGLAQEAKDTDTTSFTQGGYEEHLRVLLGRSMKVTGVYLESNMGVRDPGQAAVELIAGNIGYDAYGQFVLTSPNGDVTTFMATAQIDKTGGRKDDKVSWEVTLKLSGDVS